MARKLIFSLTLLQLVLFEDYEYAQLTSAGEMTDHQVSGLSLEVVTEVVKTDWYLRKDFNILNFEFSEFF